MARHIPGLMKFGTLAFLAVGLSWCIHRWSNISQQPSLLLGLPVALAHWPPMLANRLITLCTWPVIVGLTTLELLWPGKLFAALIAGARHTSKRFKKSTEAKTQQTSKKSYVALLVLIGIAALMWTQVGAAGYQIDTTEVLQILWTFAVLLGLPVAILGISYRCL